ncbi:MAG: tRNA dimethylallyltransferase [Candidatus Moranbacteria bacterium]|nr:tRNA dimethylallyltransferase [Candidatus Moranbacteria bacterium]
MFTGNSNDIFVIVGPTASGKSDFAISLAHEIGGEIISADSRQVYRGMDIGTGKVRRDFPAQVESQKPVKPKACPVIESSNIYGVENHPEQFISGGVRHHLLDVASPKRTYTVTHFLRDAKQAIRDIRKRGKIPIICGGTNFWIEALVFDTEFPEVKPDPVLRKELAKLTAPELFTLLQEKDSDRAETIDRHNKVRLIRALEIIATLGKVPDSKFEIRNSKFEKSEIFQFIGIDLPKEVLHERIEKRFKKRLDEGMIDEVKRLHEQDGLSWKRLEGFGLEYRWCAKLLQEKITREEMGVGLLKDSKYYAKRQMTFLRKLERRGIRIEWKR